MSSPSVDDREWLEADGLGGFAMGTASGVRTRRYHALLVTASTPPTGRVVLVAAVEAWIETDAGRLPLTSHRYAPGVIYPDGARCIASFTHEPWPRWTYRLPGGSVVEHEVLQPHGRSAVVLSWRRTGGTGPARLLVRPLLAGRDYHGTHHENGAFAFDPDGRDERLVWRLYPGLPEIVVRSNGRYTHGPLWYRGFEYVAEAARGLPAVEDLASPGEFALDLAHDEGVLLFEAGEPEPAASAGGLAARWRASERGRRAAFPTPLHRAADQYFVRRGEGSTIVAGYPWFTDWGRDTLIALRGLALATGRLDDARAILLAWAGAIDRGMLPNRFPDAGEQAEYNAVDASLWFVVAVGEYLDAEHRRGSALPAGVRRALVDAVHAIVDGHAAGTRYGIRADDDGLLAAGEPGVQLTWMDAKIGEWVVTPRHGKPVDVQALWINALDVARQLDPRHGPSFERAVAHFERRFWNEAGGYLHDVVDVEGERGRVDASFRPNQILAAGGLPFVPLSPERARRIVDEVERRLWTPLGLRSLDPADSAYRPRYEGGVLERDSAYHQGTVWPWLAGPFVEAWVRARGATPEVCALARARFLGPLFAHLDEAGLGHVSEIADAEAPHVPRGCPFQAWSVSELLRLDRGVLSAAIGETAFAVPNHKG